MKRNSRATRDAIAIAIVAVCVFVIASIFDVFEAFVEWAPQYEEWSIDELVVVAVFLAAASGIFSRRRARELRHEIAERKRVQETQSRLASIVEHSIDAIDSETLSSSATSMLAPSKSRRQPS